MTRPNIQIGDEVREMTEEEYETHLMAIQNSYLFPKPPTDEAPASDDAGVPSTDAG